MNVTRRLASGLASTLLCTAFAAPLFAQDAMAPSNDSPKMQHDGMKHAALPAKSGAMKGGDMMMKKSDAAMNAHDSMSAMPGAKGHMATTAHPQMKKSAMKEKHGMMKKNDKPGNDAQ